MNPKNIDSFKQYQIDRKNKHVFITSTIEISSRVFSCKYETSFTIYRC